MAVLKAEIGKRIVKGGMVMVLTFAVCVSLSGCSWINSVFGNEGQKVQEYNNSIVSLQKEALQKAQDAAQPFDGITFNADKASTTLLDLLDVFRQQEKKFKDIQVPKGAEELASSMQNFYEIDRGQLVKIIDSVNQVKANSASFASLRGDLVVFRSLENRALASFHDLQQKIADQYKIGIERRDA